MTTKLIIQQWTVKIAHRKGRNNMSPPYLQESLDFVPSGVCGLSQFLSKAIFKWLFLRARITAIIRLRWPPHEDWPTLSEKKGTLSEDSSIGTTAQKLYFFERVLPQRQLLYLFLKVNKQFWVQFWVLTCPEICAYFCYLWHGNSVHEYYNCCK